LPNLQGKPEWPSGLQAQISFGASQLPAYKLLSIGN